MPVQDGRTKGENKMTKHKIKKRCGAIKARGYSTFETAKIYLDFLYCHNHFCVTFGEYMTYNYMNLTNRVRKDFILGYHQNTHYRLIEAHNGGRCLKEEQYREIPDMIKRDFVNVDEVGIDALREFVSKRQRVIFKPNRGSFGRGVFAYEREENRIDEVFAEISGQGYLCEDCIVQHPEMARLTSASVNSIRVLTLKENGKVKIIDTTLKIGGGSDVCDNQRRGGLAASVDIETGVVLTPAYDMKGESHLVHPASGEQIIGFEVPLWEELKSFITDGALNSAKYPIRGWDVAITPDGPCVIEYNTCPGPLLNQIADKKPKGREILPYLKKNCKKIHIIRKNLQKKKKKILRRLKK